MNKVKTPPKGKEREMFRVGFGLLGGWVCIPDDATPEGEEKFVKELYESWGFPDNLRGDLSLVRDRLFGGFKCDTEGRTHVYVGMGHYTYTGDSNEPMGEGRRKEQWKELIEYDNGHNEFHGKGSFCEDAPKADE